MSEVEVARQVGIFRGWPTRTAAERRGDVAGAEFPSPVKRFQREAQVFCNRIASPII